MSIELLEKISSFKIDKSNWKLIKFGDVVREVRLTSPDPIAEAIERFIGLEHIETENIHIKEWGLVSNGTTFTRKFKKGQVLFGKRRAYLKKAALATFDGICSGDIVVMEAKEGLLLPELLPFLVNNDKFFDHAVKTSAGSLSPRTKFKDMAELQIFLPPIEQQAKLAELLWAADNMELNNKKLISSLKSFQNSLIYDLQINKMNSFINPTEYKSISLENLVKNSKKNLRRGPFGSNLKKEFFVESGYKVYEQSNVIYNNFESGNYFINDDKFKDLKNFEIFSGDILVSCSGTIGKIAIVPIDIQKGIMNQALLRIKLDEHIIMSKYFKYVFESEIMQNKLLQKVQGSAMKNLVSIDEMKKIEFPIVNIESQKKVIKILDKIDLAINNPLKNIKKVIINQILNNG